MDPTPTNLCLVPAGVSPDGVHNFINPPLAGPAIVTVAVVFGVLSTFFAVGRTYVNRNQLHAADYFTIAATIFNIAYTGVICSQYHYYRHVWDTPLCWYNGSYLRLPFVQTILFFPVFFFSKAAIFLLYRQLFAVGKTLRIAIDVGIAITFLLYLTQIPLAAIYSAPRAGQSWDSLLLDLKYYQDPFALAGVVQSAVGIALDMYIYILPLPILARLHVSKKRRFQLLSLFSFALIGIVASVVSMYFKIQILSSADSNWSAAWASMSTLIECNVAIVIGCGPSFGMFLGARIGESAFVRSLRSRLLYSSGSSSTNPTPNGLQRPTFGVSSPSARTPRDYHELRSGVGKAHTGNSSELSSRSI